jgi:hypothetical protein
MPIHAFVDESIRPNHYVIAAALVEPAHLSRLHRAMYQLRLPGQRALHFTKENPDRKRLLADAVARLPVELHLYLHTGAGCDESVRQRCLTSLGSDLLDRQVSRLAINSRASQDTHDARTLRSLLGPRPRATELMYDHVDRREPLLWIADIAAWCHGAGGDWRERVEPITVAEVDLTNADRNAGAGPRLH